MNGQIMVYQSINKDIQLVQLLDIGFNIRQLLFSPFLSSLQTCRIDQSHVSQFLVITVNLVPFPLQPSSDFPHLILTQTFSKIHP